MKDELLRSLRYDAWANRRVLRLLESHPELVRSKAGVLFEHVLAAQSVWIARVEGRSEGLEPFPAIDPDAWPGTLEERSRRMVELCAGGVDRSCRYRTTQGVEYVTQVGEVLRHVVAHGAYHRGQIALLARDAEVEPVNTDYITYLREVASERDRVREAP